MHECSFSRIPERTAWFRPTYVLNPVMKSVAMLLLSQPLGYRIERLYERHTRKEIRISHTKEPANFANLMAHQQQKTYKEESSGNSLYSRRNGDLLKREESRGNWRVNDSSIQFGTESSKAQLNIFFRKYLALLRVKFNSDLNSKSVNRETPVTQFRSFTAVSWWDGEVAKLHLPHPASS